MLLLLVGAPAWSARRIFDTFEYEVARDDSSGAQAFLSHGWSGVKTHQANPNVNANGYLYTTPSIPGYSGTFPGGGSRVLAIEALPGTLGGQTDFYLQFGNGQPEQIPGNVWFQFWIYVNHSGNQLSQMASRDKFLYPCNGDYPCGTGKWLLELGAFASNPVNAAPNGLPSQGDAFWSSRDNQVGTVTYSATEVGNQDKLGQQNTDTHIQPNTWILVKLHWDTSTSQGTWEAWLTPRGQPTVKVADWRSGITPNFTWTIPPEHIGGHRQFRMPTTFPGPNNSEFYDVWMYLDDFVMADSEADLPTYGNAPPVSPPGAPRNLRLR